MLLQKSYFHFFSCSDFSLHLWEQKYDFFLFFLFNLHSFLFHNVDRHYLHQRWKRKFNKKFLIPSASNYLCKRLMKLIVIDFFHTVCRFKYFHISLFFAIDFFYAYKCVHATMGIFLHSSLGTDIKAFYAILISIIGLVSAIYFQF